MSDEMVDEFKSVMDRLSGTILKVYFAKLTLRYLGWSLWMIFIAALILITWLFNLPLILYFIVMTLTFILTLYLTSRGMPRTLLAISGLENDSLTLNRFGHKVNRFIGLWWLMGVVLYTIISLLPYAFPQPLPPYVYPPFGLAVMLITGNLGVFNALKKYGGVAVGFPYIVSLVTLVSLILLPYLPANVWMAWLYTSLVLTFMYLLLAVYSLILALK